MHRPPKTNWIYSYPLKVLLSLLCLSLIESLAISEEPANESLDNKAMNLADSVQISLSRKVLNLSNQVDALFGTERLDEETSHTRARLRLGFEINEGEGFNPRQGANIALDLPRTEDRLQFVFSNTLEGEAQSPTGDGIQVPTQRDSFQTGLRYFLLNDGPKRINFDGGVRWNSGVDPFLQSRFRYIHEWGDWILTPTQFLFWRRSDGGFGEQTRFYLDRQLSGDTLFRSRTEGLLSETSDGLEYNHSFTTFTQVNQHWGHSLSARLEGRSVNSWAVDKYQLLALYRRKLDREWLYLQTGPVATFEKDRGWRFAPGLLVQLEMVVGDIGDPISFW